MNANTFRVSRPACGSHIIVLLLLAISLSGCLNRWDVTNFPPYSSYVGHAVTLKRQAALYRINLDTKLEEQSVIASFYRTAPDQPTLIAELPPGTKLWLRKITRTKDFEGGGYFVEAMGDVSIPNHYKPVHFSYSWGLDKLKRAPWDDDAIPNERPSDPNR